MQSDQSPLSLAIQNAASEDSDETARMRRLIWIFAGRTRSKVRFLTLRLLLFCRLDYCGIALLVVGSFVPWLYYSFYCHLRTHLVYLVSIVTLGLSCIIVSLWEKFAQPEYRGVRAGKYTCLNNIFYQRNKPHFMFPNNAFWQICTLDQNRLWLLFYFVVRSWPHKVFLPLLKTRLWSCI